ncbi:Rnf-Nqr domain containing protein [Pseudomonas fluorescens]|uniref:Rnf-Nqr domain containing protein n=1 Tax=Pseudomonas fluorescens TaxID=294 RepID=UPI0035265E5E
MNKPSTLQNSLMLAPLIGATDAWTTALELYVMFVVLISAYGMGMQRLRDRLPAPARLIAGLMLAATLTACAEIAAQACSLQWHQHAGVYAGLIALQCVVLEHTGFFRSPWRDRLRLCGLFGALMLGLSVLRELLGNSGLHLAALVPGGFILLGLLIAAWQAWSRPNSSH